MSKKHNISIPLIVLCIVAIIAAIVTENKNTIMNLTAVILFITNVWLVIQSIYHMDDKL